MQDQFLFFWGHQPSSDGTITKSCLSQWWEAPFQVDDITYKTAEHWMMAEKARLFKDEVALQNILIANTPAEVKAQGRLIKNFNLDVWDKHKLAIVWNGNFHKFTSNPELKSFLLSTGDQILVEASPYDNVWGIGMAADDIDARNQDKWKGENLLGFILMSVRKNIISLI